MAILAVIVRTESRNPWGKARALPVAMSTVMVSPMARPMPSMQAAMIPDMAAGSLTLKRVCQWEAPRAREASLYARGTALSESSEMLMIVGKDMMASRTLPLTAFKPLPVWKILAMAGPNSM